MEFSIDDLMTTPITLVSPLSPATISTDKFTTAILKAKEIVSLNDEHKEAPTEETCRKINARTDRLMSFMLMQFKPDFDKDGIETVIAPEVPINPFNINEIMELSEGVVPVAIMRELFKLHIPIKRKALPNWDRFSARYGTALTA
jgi:hypothetical protein